MQSRFTRIAQQTKLIRLKTLKAELVGDVSKGAFIHIIKAKLNIYIFTDSKCGLSLFLNI